MKNFAGTCAIAAIAIFGTANAAEAGVIIGGSSLLTTASENMLETWLGQGSLALTNIFTKTAGSTSYNFHSAVDGKGATFSILQVVSNGVTQIIGGYDPQSWGVSNVYYGYNYYSNNADKTAFIFNLTQNIIKKENLDSSGNYQTYSSSSYGPTFGGGHDIYVNQYLSSGYANTYSYGTYGSTNILNQGSNYSSFTITGLEVFTIAKAPTTAVPEPASLALMGIGVAGLAMTRRRKATA